MLFGGIEAGGTNFVCAVGTSPADLIKTEFPTGLPAETIARAAEFFRAHPVEAIGIGCFGPLDLATGRIALTPKLPWQAFPIVEALREATGVSRIELDTDVNTAALGEHRWGAARGIDDFLYITVGTGIGGGAMVNGRLLHGMGHPEMGHIRIPHDGRFAGNCYAHGTCLEGLASGAAIEKRWGKKGIELGPAHEAWDIELEYLAQAVVTWVATLSPKLIVMGGGVMQTVSLPKLIARATHLMNAYRELPLIVRPQLGEDAGVMGAIELVRQAANC